MSEIEIRKSSDLLGVRSRIISISRWRRGNILDSQLQQGKH